MNTLGRKAQILKHSFKKLFVNQHNWNTHTVTYDDVCEF